jgi:hypothetical protein
MNDIIPAAPIGPLRQRLIDDMSMRRFSRETQRNYVHDVGRFDTSVGRPLDTATAEESAPLPGGSARGGRSRADDEQHRLGAAVLLHTHARGRRYLPRRRLYAPGRSCRAFESRPVEGRVGDRALPHRCTWWPCRGLRSATTSASRSNASNDSSRCFRSAVTAYISNAR